MRLLNRREFNGLCVALGSYVASSDALAVEPAAGAASSGASRMVKFPTGAVVPALGQGSWHISGREDILQPKKKTRCEQAFRSA